MLALAGVPGIYFHSLFGSRGWPEGVAQSGHKRAINRQKIDRAEVERALNDPQVAAHHSLSASEAFAAGPIELRTLSIRTGTQQVIELNRRDLCRRARARCCACTTSRRSHSA